ncbi:ras-related protein Rab-37-like [Planococcus citri]|uniref:ras-related protein Rab-37-like n=1 Tax=Planococcus citri TaxID=170843 RepID=UPI0031F9D947
MAENKIERKKVFSKKSKSEDVRPVTENGTSSARRTTISSNSSVKSTKSQLSHMYGSLTESDLTYKLVILGDSGVGKTCLLLKFRDNTFLSGNFISTVGIDYRNKVVDIDGTKVKLQIWDTAGQERFRSVTHAYYRDAHALLLLYDVTNKTSFDNIRAWLGEIKEYAQDDVVIMLLGNKTDCKTSSRVIRREDGEKLAKEYNVAFMETSAKTGLNVDLAFTAIARELLSKNCKESNNSGFKVQDYIREQTQKNTCVPCGT